VRLLVKSQVQYFAGSPGNPNANGAGAAYLVPDDPKQAHAVLRVQRLDAPHQEDEGGRGEHSKDKADGDHDVKAAAYILVEVIRVHDGADGLQEGEEEGGAHREVGGQVEAHRRLLCPVGEAARACQCAG
jgi:hypothetical protein